MISLLVVNYRSAPLAIEAIRTARAATSQQLQVVVVDNSNEADALRPHADVLLESKTNRGYAGGINDGRAHCSGDIVIVANPDVLFAQHAIDALVDALKDAAVAGPALFWDDAHRWILPPSDLHTAWQKIDEVLASRSHAWMQTRDRRRFLQRVKFWSLSETTEVPALSGAVMAFHRNAPSFDERFALYFEETDFLRRIHGRIVYVPSARVRHLYNQSAGQVSSEAAARYAQSELRYLEKWNGPFLARLLKKLEQPPLGVVPSAVEGFPATSGDFVFEASPLANFATAAGCFDNSDLPPEVLQSWRGDVIYMRAVERRTGRVAAAWARRIRP
ncbi:MAG TPA: glycosyltransferase [Thermoanaerobaculia bacterium]|nr:glycosyltransferase [Thermoanaerobaculia bacterium]